MWQNPRPVSTETPDRTYDLVLFGATGFTGQLVAEYLLEHAPDGLRWALAGRNAEKLERVKGELAAHFPAAKDLPVEVGDSLDEAAMQRIAQSTKVVCTTVGPYAKYGLPLAGACAAAGTHYCDLTGETQFIRRVIDAHEETAQRTGARIVHCCGFDSIPSDMGTFMLGEAMKARGGTLSRVQAYFGESSGTFSGGTVASLLNVLDEVKADPKLRRVLGHPYGLNPVNDQKGPDGSDQTGVRYDNDIGMWTAPFVMASINTRIVRRSQALFGHPHGREFRYSEVMSMGKGAKGFTRAAAMTGGLGAFLAAVNVGPARRYLENNKLPKPGEGPSREQREAGFFVARFLGWGTDAQGVQVALRGRVEGRKDPGYGETAKMLAESAMCLALDELSSEGGVLTPSTAMGTTLLERLRAAGMVFDVAQA